MSVSISSGVAQLVSAFPVLFTYRVWIAVGMILFIMTINLRGVKESGAAFAVPTYFFLVMMTVTILIGLARALFGGLGAVVNPPPVDITLIQPLTLFIILRAFANGT